MPKEGFLNPIDGMAELQLEMQRRLDIASYQPIPIERVNHLEKELADIRDSFIKTGKRTADDLKREGEIEEEIVRSCAIANTLTEFSMLLDLADKKYGLAADLKDRYVPHENSHMNVAEAEGYTARYALLLINSGNTLMLQPLVLSKPDLNWEPFEMVLKDERTAKAPADYGDTLSDGDKETLEKIGREKEELGIDNYQI